LVEHGAWLEVVATLESCEAAVVGGLLIEEVDVVKNCLRADVKLRNLSCLQGVFKDMQLPVDFITLKLSCDCKVRVFGVEQTVNEVCAVAVQSCKGTRSVHPVLRIDDTSM
jgi:hypothetical protein